MRARPDGRGKVRFPHQVTVHGVGGAAALRDRPHDQRGAAVGVTADEHAGRVRLPIRSAPQRTAAVERRARARRAAPCARRPRSRSPAGPARRESPVNHRPARCPTAVRSSRSTLTSAISIARRLPVLVAEEPLHRHLVAAVTAFGVRGRQRCAAPRPRRPRRPRFVADLRRLRVVVELGHRRRRPAGARCPGSPRRCRRRR